MSSKICFCQKSRTITLTSQVSSERPSLTTSLSSPFTTRSSDRLSLLIILYLFLTISYLPCLFFHSFPLNADRVDESQLVEVVGKDFHQSCLEAIENRIRLRKLYSRSGTVLDAKEYTPESDDNIGHDRFYPVKALVQGVKWPEGINPVHREQYLCDEEFESIFGMRKLEFQGLCAHRKIALKKQHLLF